VAWGFLTLHPGRVLQTVILNAPHPVAMAKALMTNPKQLQKSWYISESFLSLESGLNARLRLWKDG
jgi:hypothetical protein